MTDPAIIEAAMRALNEIEDLLDLRCGDDDDAQKVVHAIVAAITPLIRAAALEEAAQIAEGMTNIPFSTGDAAGYVHGQIDAFNDAAAAIRALKEQP